MAARLQRGRPLPRPSLPLVLPSVRITTRPSSSVARCLLRPLPPSRLPLLCTFRRQHPFVSLARPLSTTPPPSHPTPPSDSSPFPPHSPSSHPPTSSSLVPLFPSRASSPHSVGNPRLLSPPSFISDSAHLLSPPLLSSLSSLLSNLHRHCGAEVAVVTLHSLLPASPASPPPSPSSVAPFARQLFDLWGVGDPTANTGVLVLLVTDLRRVEVVTGPGAVRLYGLSDAVVGQLLDRGLVPLLKEDRWGEALEAAVQALDAVIRASPGGQQGAAARSAGATGGTGGGGKGGWGGGMASPLSSGVPQWWVRFAPLAAFVLLVLAGWAAPRGREGQVGAGEGDRCVKCQGKTETIGVVDGRNLRAQSSLTAVPRQDEVVEEVGEGEGGPLVYVHGNARSEEFALDYRQVLETLDGQQVEAVRRGGELDVRRCVDCGTMHVQQQRVRGLGEEKTRGRVRDGLGREGEWRPTPQVQSWEPRTRRWLTAEERRAMMEVERRQQALRQQQQAGGGVSDSGGFGGGSSAGGGGGGASF